MILQWSTVALWAAGFLVLSADPVTASAGYRPGKTACPALCNTAGPYPSNWSLYHNFDQLQSCNQALFLDFSLYDDVDNPDTLHRLYSCTSYGANWANQPKISTSVVPVETVNATYQIGWSSDGGVLAAADISTLSRQIRRYLGNDYGARNESNILFARSNGASLGVYLGSGIENKGVGSFALKALEDHLSITHIRSGSIAMQLCLSGDDGTHFFGLMATSNWTFSPVQSAIKSWSAADCLSFDSSRNISGPAMFTTSLLSSRTKSYVSNTTNNTSNPMWSSSSPATWRSNRSLAPTSRLSARSYCRTIQVQRGDGCPSLAIKCGISGAQFTKFNPSSTLCSSLIAGQHVCCSAGSLPNFTPKPNADGSCFPYTIKANDVCKTIAASYDITVTQLEKYNTRTWAWPGCSRPLWVGTIICLTSGTPPMPAPVANAVCGPQKPGTSVPSSGTDIATLNPCPLNACCDVWGQVIFTLRLTRTIIRDRLLIIGCSVASPRNFAPATPIGHQGPPPPAPMVASQTVEPTLYRVVRLRFFEELGILRGST